jgi:hypothetical protein
MLRNASKLLPLAARAQQCSATLEALSAGGSCTQQVRWEQLGPLQHPRLVQGCQPTSPLITRYSLQVARR